MDVKLPERKSSMTVVSSVMAIALLGSLVSCGEITTTPTDPNRQNVVHGLITSQNVPLQEVQVSGGAETVASDATGNYRTFVPNGDTTLVFTKAGYADVRKSVSAAAKAVIQADIAMTTASTASTSTTGTTGAGGGSGADEYVVREGHFVEFPINTASGWIEFDVTLDESGRGSDWDRKAIMSLYDGSYHSATTGLVDLLPYKLKWCYARVCKEPRYNLPWSRWRRVRLEWTTTSVAATIDGVKVGGSLVSPFNPADTRLVYGDHPNGRGPMPGARLRNFSRSN